MEVTKKFLRRTVSRSAGLAFAGCLALAVLSPAARAQGTGEMHGYRPQSQGIPYSRSIPASVQRIAQKVGPSRFFGTFRRGEKTYAVHFYDTGGIHAERSAVHSAKLERNSRLDLFQLEAGKTWRRLQSFALVRFMDDRRDKVKIEARSLWLDPTHKKVPMVYLRIMENENDTSTGNRTDVFGAVPDKATPRNFISFNGNIPYSDATVTLSEISYPDPEGKLTLLTVITNPGDTSYTAYAWTDEGWKMAGQKSFDNAYETALRWNGAKFVPMAHKRRAPQFGMLPRPQSLPAD